MCNILEQAKLPHTNIAAKKYLEETLDIVCSNRGEGPIIRSPNSFWAPQRVHTCLKVKSSHDAEAIVIGYTFGRQTELGSKLLGLMGALIVRYKNVEFELSGFTDEERRMTDFEFAANHPGEKAPSGIYNPMFPIGSVVTFKYRELTDGNIPKEARYFRRFKG